MSSGDEARDEAVRQLDDLTGDAYQQTVKRFVAHIRAMCRGDAEEMLAKRFEDGLARILARGAPAPASPQPASECLCAEIQFDDPRRHFKGCPLRKELPETKPQGATHGTRPIARRPPCKHLNAWVWETGPEPHGCKECRAERIEAAVD